MTNQVMSGIEFWQKTELGRALAKRLPPDITRAIIDIGIDEAVKIYYSTVDTGPVLDLKWDEVIDQFTIIKPELGAKIDELIIEVDELIAENDKLKTELAELKRTN